MATVALLLSLVDRFFLGEFDPYSFPLWAVLIFVPIVAWIEVQGLDVFVKFLSSLKEKPQPIWRLPLLTISFGLSQTAAICSIYVLHLGFDNGVMLGSVAQFGFVLLLDKILNLKNPIA